MRRATICLVLAIAAHASAGTLAEVTADLDGDGTPDRATIGDDGTLRIETRAGAATIKITEAGATRAAITAAQVKQVPMMVVRVTRPAGEEAIVVGKQGGDWRVVVRTPVGGMGLDQDYGVEVAATPAGVIRYQTRPGYHRCDGQPAYLFAEGFTGTKFQRLSKIPTDVPEAAPVIAARVDREPAQPPLEYQARIASHQPRAESAGDLGIPTELDDGKLDTAWREGFAASDGAGQFFTFEPRMGSAKAAQLRVIGSKRANRPHRLGVVAAHGAWHVELPDAANEPAGTAFVADLPAPVDGCVTVVLESTYGPANGDTELAELEVYGDGERAGGGEAALAHVIAEGSDGATSAAQALARRGAAGVTAIDAELAKATDAEVRRRLVRALVLDHDPSAGPLLARAAAHGWVKDQDLIDLIAVLATTGQAQELRELAHHRELPLEARIVAVKALATSPDREQLIDLAGDGSIQMRHAVIEELAKMPLDKLIAAAQATQRARAAGDLWRAVTWRAHAVVGDRPAALAAMIAALPSANDYDRRYRLIDGLAAIGDAAAIATLTKLLHGLPADANRAGFEQIAARAIAANPRPEALDLVFEFAREADPGVRLAALGALATAETGAAGPWHAKDGPDSIDRVIGTALASDTWPEVRRRAAQTLGTRCARVGPAKQLEAAVARDPDLGVRGDALAGLVDCKAAGVAGVLAQLWDDGKAPIELRQRAIDLTAVLGDRAFGSKLIGRLATWRGSAISSTPALALAQSAAYALGRLAPPGAAEALDAALDDAAFPEIVAAAATGLGQLGPACPARDAAKLRDLANSDDPTVQVAAQHAAAQCGH